MSELAPWWLLTGAALLMLGASGRRVGRWLVWRLAGFPLLLHAGYGMFQTAWEGGLPWWTFLLLPLVALLVPLALSKGIRDAVLGAAIYDFLRFVLRWGVRLALLPLRLLFQLGRRALRR